MAHPLIHASAVSARSEGRFRLSTGEFRTRWQRLVGELLAEHLRQRYAEGLPRPARLLPVPLAPRRERRRGFNQAQQLA
ncbi:hypothetical protein K3Z87_24645, partial [Pseudomonas aeruginosa]|nr:hypothetical protein [Pseudomonas aeruginosa]